MRVMWRIRSFGIVQAEEVLPGPWSRTLNQLEDYVRSIGLRSSHGSGTARMGRATDRMAVVDSECRVFGIDGLRVCDASVFPDCRRTTRRARVPGGRSAGRSAHGRRHAIAAPGIHANDRRRGSTTCTGPAHGVSGRVSSTAPPGQERPWPPLMSGSSEPSVNASQTVASRCRIPRRGWRRHVRRPGDRDARGSEAPAALLRRCAVAIARSKWWTASSAAPRPIDTSPSRPWISASQAPSSASRRAGAQVERGGGFIEAVVQHVGLREQRPETVEKVLAPAL